MRPEDPGPLVQRVKGPLPGARSPSSGVRAIWSAIRPAHDFGHRGPTFVAPYASARRGTPPLADVHLPAAPTGASVVLVHGGGFVVGWRRMPAIAALTARLVSDGVAVMAFDYRMIGRGGRFIEAVDDARAALDWWVAQTGAHGLDLGRVTLCGLSAGGALALASLTGRAAMSAPRAVIGVYGVYDFLAMPVWARTLGPRLLHRTWDREEWARRSPCRTFDLPIPTLLLHGEADTLVPIVHSERLAAFRAARDLPVRLERFPGEPHAFLVDPRRPAWEPAYRAILEHVLASP